MQRLCGCLAYCVLDEIGDKCVNLRVLLPLFDRSVSLFPFTHLHSVDSKAPADNCAPAPRCVLSTCSKPVEQGLCPKHFGRYAAYDHADYVDARETEVFVHPWIIMPGTVLKRPLQSNPRKRRAPSDKVTRDLPVTALALVRA